jgi:tetratricopeptide (TPR) repeat protein
VNTTRFDGLAASSAAAIDKASLQVAEMAYRDGVGFWNEGRREEAIAALDAALRAKPDFPEALCMGGYILGIVGKHEAALSFYRRTLQFDPRCSIAWSNMGKLLFELRRFGEALEAFDAWLKVTPHDPDGWNCRAGALRELGRLQESIEAAEEALRINPNFAEAALNLGNALFKLDRAEEALELYKRAVAIKPDFSTAHCGMALALKALSRFDEALAAFDEAERLGSVEAIGGKGCLRLLQGDFASGWEGYEARWLDGKSLKEALGARFPEWKGPADSAQRVLVMNDHGLGDTIQFCRYVRLMALSGIDVTLLCPTRLHRLLSSLGARLIAALPADEGFDAQIAISSLPRAYATRLDQNLPNEPYLAAEPDLCAKWAALIGAHGFKIGLVWQGNPNPEADMARSIPLRVFASLARIPNVRLISLQKGFGVEQVKTAPPQMRIETFDDELDQGPDAFLDTAAAMMHVDLIVTCDTSAAHLAGALGRPVWVALKKDAEWRWLLEREDSPWYPTMRLFRQERRGAWESVAARIAEAVALAMQPQPKLIALPCAVGELIDKITILEIKLLRLKSGDQLRNVRRELALLEEIVQSSALARPELETIKSELAAINECLWEIEDDIRNCESRGDFGPNFIDLARAVYRTNDQRALLKRRINLLFNSAIIEEKSYTCRDRPLAQSGMA